MGTTTQKLQKLIQTKQKLVDNVNTMCGTDYNVNSKLEDVANSVLDIQTGIDTTDATATPNDMLLGKTAYVNDQKIEGIVPIYDGSNSEDLEVNSSIKTLLDRKNNADYLFFNYKGASVSDVIGYNDTENITSTKYMFEGCTNLTTIPLLNTSNVTDMSYMFRICESLLSVPALDTSKVTNMQYMFTGCKKLLEVSQLDTSKLSSLASVFSGCNELQSIPQLNTSNVTNLGNAFVSCTKLKTIDLSSMDKVSTTSSTSGMCQNCYSLTKFIIRNMTKVPPINTNAFNKCYHFTGTQNSPYNPEGLKDGRIYVPDEIINEVIHSTNWSELADIIYPLSYLEGGTE